MKRALPYDAEYPREHIESTRDLMIVIDSINTDEEFLKDLREYFSSYGTLYACKYCHEANFDYILVEFADFGKRKNKILFFFLVDNFRNDRRPNFFDFRTLLNIFLLRSNRSNYS